MGAVHDGAANAAAAGVSAHSMGDTADSATAVADSATTVVTAPEPGAPVPPAAAAQPPPAGPTAQKTPALDSGGATLAAVAAAAELLKSKEAADSRAAAELAELKKSNHEELGGARGAGGAVNGKRPSVAPKPRALTDMEKEQALAAQILPIEDQAIALQTHDPTTSEYLVQVVRVHCVDPAFRVFYSAVFTMFRCRGRPQAALEAGIHGIFASVDKDKRTEFLSLITQLHGRVPPRPKPVVQVFDGTSTSFDKLLGNLASADIAAKVPKEDAPRVLPEIEAFVLGAVTPKEDEYPGVRLQGEGRLPPLNRRRTSC